jgi:DNA replication initiation complex subunit (GINS family)
MALNYSDLQSIYRFEKKSASLQKVPEDLYSELSSLISKLDDEYRNSALKIADEICSMRRGKILRLASRTGESAPPANMTPVEKGMYREILDILSRYEKRTLNPEKPPEMGDAKKEPDDGKITVRIVKPMPAIVGSDMAHYGPFKENDEVRLPEDIARILIEKGMAEEI